MESKLQHIYAISYSMQKMKEINYTELLNVFYRIEKILETDYFIFLEKSPVVKNYLTYRYDSRVSHMLQSESFMFESRQDFAHIFEEINIIEGWMIQKVKLWNQTLGYFVLWNDYYDRNVMNVIANLVSPAIYAIQQQKIVTKT